MEAHGQMSLLLSRLFLVEIFLRYCIHRGRNVVPFLMKIEFVLISLMSSDNYKVTTFDRAKMQAQKGN
jgi:hypothetical protein